MAIKLQCFLIFLIVITNGLIQRVISSSQQIENVDTFESSKLVQGDILIPIRFSRNNVQGGAIAKQWAKFWPQNKDKKYELVYDVSYFQNNKALLMNIYWAMEYISRGSNIVFREKNATDTAYVRFMDKTLCFATIGYTGTIQRLSLGPSCNFPSIIVHELLHSLGLVHEHQRHDRDSYIEFPTVQDPTKDRSRTDFNYILFNDTQVYTPYDAYSLMHYDGSDKLFSQGTFRYKDSKKKIMGAGQRSFLTSCDWYTLNKIYPGPKRTPLCRANILSNYLEPSEEFLNLFSRNGTYSNCYYNNANYFKEGLCRLINGEEFPPMPWVNEISQLESRQVFRKKKKEFCSKFNNQKNLRLNMHDCANNCLKNCPSKYPMLTLPDCMKLKFPLCQRKKRDKNESMGGCKTN